MKFILLPVFFICLLSFSSLEAQTIRFVEQSASGNSDGTSWANAFTRFQQALAVAQDGDEIWVAQGTYKPSTNNDRYAFYNLPSGVKVYGGFVGTETQLEQRDWATNLTILSGDIGVPGDSTDNSFNILYSYSPNEKTLLDGLVFEEGNATNTDPGVDFHRPTRSGGGIYLDGENFGYAQLSVVNCTFRRNRAQYQGGGIYANGREGGMAIVRLEGCLFERNWSGYYGSGFSLENYFEQPFALEVKSCEFRENNRAAVWLRANQAVTFLDCKFLHNNGNSIVFDLMESNYTVEFSRCLFEKSTRTTIQYIPFSDPENDAIFKFQSCIFRENNIPVIHVFFPDATNIRATFKNCIFNSNKDPFFEEFVIQLLSESNEKDIIFANSLFFNNAGHEVQASSMQINNCIIIDGIGTKGIFRGETCVVSNSLFRVPSCDSIDGNGINAIVICDSTNLFGLDPLFVNPSISDFHLQPCSPAINAGMNAILDSLGISTDLDGNPRIRNEVVDMGPYETNITLHPSVSGQPACAGLNTGVVKLSPNICPPYAFVWNNGVTTGTNTNGLAAGTYIFTVTGANNIPVSDTIVISEPTPVTVIAAGHDVTCNGIADGWLEASANGGTPAYTYTWDGIFAPFNLPPGTYTVTATDAKGCTGSAQASIGSADPIQVFYTIQDASCMVCSDGSIVFDSIVGGNNPPLPPSLINIPAGYYCLTITDAAGCTISPCFTITTSSEATEETLSHDLKLSPNPTIFGETSWLEWLDNEPATLRVLDSHGRMIEEKRIAQNTSTRLKADWPPGIYLVEIHTVSGKRAVRRWAIF